MKIHLTESTFKNMLTEMMKEVLLLEAKMSLNDIYDKYYSGKIDRNVFDAAIAADPTSYNPQGNIVKVGKYVKWILNLAKQEKWKPGDSFETKKTLSNFVKHQKRLPVEQRDIKIYNSVRELYDILRPYVGIKSRSEIKQEEATKVYEDEQWEIIIPHTEEAACLYGKGTKWCTAAENSENMFESYNELGPLYINIYKPKNRKYQFHFESSSFMDEEDNEIQPYKLPWTEGALNYYKSINKYIYIRSDIFHVFEKYGIAKVRLNNEWNFFSLEKEEVLFPNQGFEEIGRFDSKGIAAVKKNGKQTWFSLEKQDYLFPNKWFQWVDDFNSKGIARVKLNNKYTWFSLEKQDYLFPNKWFQWLEYFDSNGIAKVKLNNKWYYFTLEGQFLDYKTRQPLSDEELQQLSNQQLVSEMVNRLVKNYLR